MASLTVQVYGPDGYLMTVAVGRRIPKDEAIALAKSKLQQTIEDAEENLKRVEAWEVKTMRGKIPARSYEEYEEHAQRP